MRRVLPVLWLFCDGGIENEVDMTRELIRYLLPCGIRRLNVPQSGAAPAPPEVSLCACAAARRLYRTLPARTLPSDVRDRRWQKRPADPRRAAARRSPDSTNTCAAAPA